MGGAMKRVGAYEAKTHLSELLDEVSKGARISITRKGVPVAVMVPPSPRGKGDVGESIRKLKEFRKGITLGGMSIRELVGTGRRRKVIAEGTGPGRRKAACGGASLAAQAGGWTEKDARDFRESVRVFEEIDVKRRK